MANSEHLKIIKQGKIAWNHWRAHHVEIKPNLNGADLSEVDLSKVNLSGAGLLNADLRKANLHEADLIGADLRKANLFEADLSEAHLWRADLSEADLIRSKLWRTDLRETNFTGAKLWEADLREANLGKADFSSVNLKGANLAGANLNFTNLCRASFSNADFDMVGFGDTILVDTNLSNAKHLEFCKHFGPSVIDHRTLGKSGRLPLEFLRGCGLPDFIIDNVNLFYENPIQFYSCFISYSARDEEFVRRLHADLQDRGVRCWLAPEDMKGGEKLLHQIDEAIRLHDKLLLVLSEDSMKSDWVATEIKKAMKREKQEGRQMLFPIGITSFENIKQWELFDSDSGKDLAAEVRSYFIPDFKEWKHHEPYQKAFKKLVEDLKGIKKSEEVESTS